LADGVGQVSDFGSLSAIVRTPAGSTVTLNQPFPDLWTAAGRERGLLGDPLLDDSLGENDVRYADFQGGYIAIVGDGPPYEVRGARYTGAGLPPHTRCAPPDRPCAVARAGRVIVRGSRQH